MSGKTLSRNPTKRKPLHRKAGRVLTRIVTMSAQSQFGIGEEGRFRYRADDDQRRWEFDFVARRNRQRIARLRIYRGAKHPPILWIARDVARQPRRPISELFTTTSDILRAHREPIAEYQWTGVPSAWREKSARFFALEPREPIRPGRRSFLLMIPSDPREPARLDLLVWDGESYSETKVAAIPQLQFVDVLRIARVCRSQKLLSAA